jgi:hypothetical protein
MAQEEQEHVDIHHENAWYPLRWCRMASSPYRLQTTIVWVPQEYLKEQSPNFTWIQLRHKFHLFHFSA